MTPEEAQAIVVEAHELWPMWKVNQAQTKAWEANFQSFSAEPVCRAIQEHFRQSRFSAPNLAAILALARSYANPGTVQHEETTPRLIGVYVQCVLAGSDGRGPVGCYRPVIQAQPLRDWPHDRIMAAATEMANSHAVQYGGQWQVIRGATELDMARRRAELIQQQVGSKL
jgi:hypothetical protein